ncbi:hypothetical protein V1514DRAFT_324760 [Lipomyces japonicus]|uniref:uncharacterized protein n=1 Tax=Lipomyces japonicus TaxID=56871 RepID=UPI0034D0211F
MKGVILLLLLMQPLLALAQFDFFQQMFEGGHGHGHGGQQRSASGAGPEWFAQNYDTLECDKYVCPDTLACVKKPVDCPCAFPGSEEKCILPDKKTYVCISKNGRGCGFVEKAWKGQV